LPPGSNANGLAVIVLTGDQAGAAHGGGFDPNARRTPTVTADATPKRLSVHLEFVDPDRQPTSYRQPVIDAQAEEVAPPRPSALPTPPLQPTAAEMRSGTPEAHRAVAAYNSQLEQYNRLRYERDEQVQHVRMRA
jgi:hypothetical protein